MPIHLKLLGTFEASTGDGRRLLILGKKPQALLAYLAMPAGRMRPRGELASLLWGQRNDQRARHSLSQVLTRLRGWLEECGSELFVTARDDVMLDPHQIEVDAVEIELRARGTSLAALASAAELYRGDFLEGIDLKEEPFEDWVLSRRYELRETAIRVLRALSEIGDPEQSIAAVKRLLSLSPLDESMHRHLMKLQLEAGRADLALLQYDRCRDVLRRELGAEPDSATRQLHRDALSMARKAPGVAPSQPTQPDRGRGEPARSGPGQMTAPALPERSSIGMTHHEAGKARPAVAVLPFHNMSKDPEQEYFADGITEDLITALSYQRLFPVLGRHSTFVFKNRNIDRSQVGLELGAGYIIEGSIRKANNRVRINAQLIDARSGHHVWAERYDRDLDDIFELQDEIVSNIVSRVAPELSEFELLQTRSKPPQDMSVWDLYLRAQAESNKATESGFASAEVLLRMASDKENSFPPAHSLLANIFWNQYFRGYRRRRASDILADMMRSAQAAIDLDSHEAVAHSMLGCGLAMQREYDRGISQTRRALVLNPYAFWSHCALAFSFFMAGQIAESLQEFKAAIRIGTHDPNLFHAATMVVWSNYVLGNYEAAAAAIPQAEALAPGYIRIQAVAAATWAQLGVSDSASTYMSQIVEAVPRLTVGSYRRQLRWRNPKFIELFLDGMRKAGLPE